MGARLTLIRGKRHRSGDGIHMAADRLDDISEELLKFFAHDHQPIEPARLRR